MCYYCFILYYTWENTILGIFLSDIIKPNPEAVLHKGAMTMVKYPLIADCRPWKERQEGEANEPSLFLVETMTWNKPYKWHDE